MQDWLKINSKRKTWKQNGKNFQFHQFSFFLFFWQFNKRNLCVIYNHHHHHFQDDHDFSSPLYLIKKEKEIKKKEIMLIPINRYRFFSVVVVPTFEKNII